MVKANKEKDIKIKEKEISFKKNVGVVMIIDGW